MEKHKMVEIIKAIEACSGNYSVYELILRTGPSETKQWDKIICVLCTGCRKPLGKQDTQKRVAFCFECREILFPETLSP